MEKSKLLSLSVVFIIILNMVLLLKIGDLNSNLEAIRHNYNQLQSNLYSVSGNVNQTLERFTREQSWITPLQINDAKSRVTQEQGIVVLNWQIKDFPKGSEALFYYSNLESEEFKALPLDSQNTGLFEVQLPLETRAEPFWDIQVSRVGAGGGTQPAAAVEIKQPDQSLRCYVSMETKDSIKSSEVSYFNVDYLAYLNYEPIRGHLFIDGKHYNISLFEDTTGNNGFDSLSAAFYNGNDLLAQKPIEVQHDANGIKNYGLSYDSASAAISRIILQVKYKNGDTFQRDILN